MDATVATDVVSDNNPQQQQEQAAYDGATSYKSEIHAEHANVFKHEAEQLAAEDDAAQHEQLARQVEEDAAAAADDQTQDADAGEQYEQVEADSEHEHAAGYKIDPSLATLASPAVATPSHTHVHGHSHTAAGRYNPYPVPFHPHVAKDGDVSSTDSSGHHTGNAPGTPIAQQHHHHQHMAGGPIRTSSTPGAATPGTARSSTGGRQSIMLGHDGRPIPEHERPAVGTEEYALMRRVNHKEVEKKRRETINDGINALAAQLQKEYTTSEKNKGAILSKAAQYIERLKQNEASYIERWTLEKLLCDQTIAELQGKCDHLLKEVDRAWKECEAWRVCADGGPRPVGLQGPAAPDDDDDEEAAVDVQQEQQQHHPPGDEADEVMHGVDDDTAVASVPPGYEDLEKV